MEPHRPARLLPGDEEASAATLAALLNSAPYIIWEGASPPCTGVRRHSGSARGPSARLGL
jgi:hypothetical protein